MLYKHKFGILAIERLYDVAKRYGEPLEVFKAIEKYGELKALESDIEKLMAKKNELNAKVKELESKVEELRSIMAELKYSISEMLNAIAKEAKESVKSITAEFMKTIEAIKSKYEEYAKRYGELKAEAGKLEEELILAEAIQSIIKYPTEAKNLPLDLDLIMLKAIIQHCKVKGVNPKVKAGDVISKKYYGISSYTDVELLDLLDWASEGLTSALEAKAEST
ncbi:MAG: hypothetical protein QW589_03660 [Candidatus Bathyarchaeia archaeon]